MGTTRWIAAALALLLGACGGTSGGGDAATVEPKLETDPATLDAALDCTAFEHPDKPPVLLVHGTFTTGFEQYEWTYKPLLIDRGYDVCTVTYPDRGFGDMQVSAEYVVNALRRIHAQSGRKVAVIGHSQGVSVPRWAIKWWPSARNAVDDFVMQAGPNHGTDVTLLTSTFPALTGGLLGLPAVFYQFAPDSQFMAATNAGDETPGDIDYTALYTQFDELVQPVSPPTAAVDLDLDNPKVANILIQDICPGRFVDHVTIGLLDAVSFALTLDAIEHPGPADVERAGGAGLCNLLPIVPDLEIAPLPELLGGVVNALLQEPANGAPALHLVSEEPPLKPYAQ
jgi:triacylglycerol lipase